MEKTGFVKVVKPTNLGEIGVTLPVDLQGSENHLKTAEKVIREISQFLDSLGQGFDGSAQAEAITAGNGLELVEEEEADATPPRRRKKPAATRGGRGRGRPTEEAAEEEEEADATPPRRRKKPAATRGGRGRGRPTEEATEEPGVGQAFVDAWVNKHLSDQIGRIVDAEEPGLSEEEFHHAFMEELESNYIMDKYETLAELPKAHFLKWGESAKKVLAEKA